MANFSNYRAANYASCAIWSFQHTVLSNTLFFTGKIIATKIKQGAFNFFPRFKRLAAVSAFFLHFRSLQACRDLAVTNNSLYRPALTIHVLLDSSCTALLLVVIYIDYYILRFTVEEITVRTSANKVFITEYPFEPVSNRAGGF